MSEISQSHTQLSECVQIPFCLNLTLLFAVFYQIVEVQICYWQLTTITMIVKVFEWKKSEVNETDPIWKFYKIVLFNNNEKKK